MTTRPTVSQIASTLLRISASLSARGCRDHDPQAILAAHSIAAEARALLTRDGPGRERLPFTDHEEIA